MQKARRHISQDAPTACKRKVSGSISLPCSGAFSPFPHGTGSLSVSQEYLALADGAASFTQNFSGSALLRNSAIYLYRTYTGLSPSMVELSSSLPFLYKYNHAEPYYPTLRKMWFGLFPVRSPLLRESRLFSFPPGT